MISCCLKALRGCNDRFAFVLLLLCLFFYSVFSFILFPCYSVFILSCLVSFVTLPFLLFCFLFYLVLFPLLLCLSFYPVLFPCYSVFFYLVLFSMLLCLPFTLSILYLSTKHLVYLSTRSLVHSMFINVKY